MKYVLEKFSNLHLRGNNKSLGRVHSEMERKIAKHIATSFQTQSKVLHFFPGINTFNVFSALNL